MQKAVDEGEGTTDLQMNSNPNLCGRIMLLELILKNKHQTKMEKKIPIVCLKLASDSK